MKLLSGNLNPDPCSPHLTSTYTCKVIIVPKVRARWYYYLLIGMYYDCICVWNYIFYNFKKI